MWILSILIGIVVSCLNKTYVLKYEICSTKTGSDFLPIHVYEHIHAYKHACNFPSSFREHPTFLFYMLLYTIGIFKSYPGYGDVGLMFALLPLWKHVYQCKASSFFVCSDLSLGTDLYITEQVVSFFYRHEEYVCDRVYVPSMYRVRSYTVLSVDLCRQCQCQLLLCYLSGILYSTGISYSIKIDNVLYTYRYIYLLVHVYSYLKCSKHLHTVESIGGQFSLIVSLL